MAVSVVDICFLTYNKVHMRILHPNRSNKYIDENVEFQFLK